MQNQNALELKQTSKDAALWMGFIGYFMIVLGVLHCLSIIGAVLGIPYIFVGINFNKAADELQDYVETKHIKNLQKFIEAQKTSFLISAILIIIGTLFSVLLLALYATLIGAMLSNGQLAEILN